MIIKALAARRCGGADVAAGERARGGGRHRPRGAAASTASCDDVLDFARPLRLEYAPADLNALCRDAAAAALSRRRRARLRHRAGPRAWARVVTDARAPAHGARQRAEQRPRGGARGGASGRRTAAPTSSCPLARAAAGRVAITVRGPRASASPPATCRTSSSPTSRPSARAPAWAWPSPRTSWRPWAARCSRAAGARRARRCASSCRAPGRLAAERGMNARAAPSCWSTTRRSILKTLGRAPARGGPRGGRRHQRARGPAPAGRARSFDVLVVDNRMPERTGLELIRELAAATPGGRAAADRDDDRPRHRRERDRGHEAGRLRLPAEALRGGRAAGGRAARPGAPAAAHAAPLPALRARGGVQPLRHRGPQPRHPGADPQAGAGGAEQEHGADHGRDRHRQGAGRARHPRPQRAARHAAHQGELRGHPRDAARVGAVRPREGRVHRRHREQEGHASRWPTAAPSSWTRSAP